MKSCPQCAASIDDAARFCSSCGAHAATQPVVTSPAGTPIPGMVVAQPETSGKAVASLVLGIGIFLFSVLAGIPAIIFGHLAKSDIRKSGGRLQGDGMALAGLILGYLSVAFIPVVLILAAIAIPNLLRARMVANEASAVDSMRIIVTAAATYRTAYNKGFPPDLASLGPPSGSSADSDRADLIDEELAAGSRHGYVFTYRAASTSSNGALDAFQLNADPVSPGASGVRHFFVDQTGVIRHSENGPADQHSPALQYRIKLSFTR